MLLFFQFIKIKDLKSQSTILKGIFIGWAGICAALIVFIPSYIYFIILTAIASIVSLLPSITLKEEIIEQLTEIKGVGKWTVEMILMFTLERFDVLPLDDLAIRNRMIQLYEVTTTGRALKSDLTKIAEVWRPYRSVACRYLWEWGDLQK